MMSEKLHQGLRIRGTEGGKPWFVASKDLRRNILYVVQGDKNPALYSYGLEATINAELILKSLRGQ